MDQSDLGSTTLKYVNDFIDAIDVRGTYIGEFISVNNCFSYSQCN